MRRMQERQLWAVVAGAAAVLAATVLYALSLDEWGGLVAVFNLVGLACVATILVAGAGLWARRRERR